MTDLPRPEYPRPRLRRDRWVNLNGTWSFAFDDDDSGVESAWYRATPADLAGTGGPFERTITVPYCYQAKLSGIGDRSPHDVVWYARVFVPPPLGPDERLLLHFGAVDYTATVWVNGVHVAAHGGGHTPFTADVTRALAVGDNVVVVRAEDRHADLALPRGKQYWREDPEGIFYTPTSGIWQTVWLEPVPARRVTELVCTPDLDSRTLEVELYLTGGTGLTAEFTVHFGQSVVLREQVDVAGDRLDRTLGIGRSDAWPPDAHVGEWAGVHLWSPEIPSLYDLRVVLRDADGAEVDAVDSYFGMRRVEVRDGRFYLNGSPYFQRLVLDQGYFPDGLLTAPTDDELRRDIELAKEMGFNGARKHQKVEDPRWLYWADRLGFLVWGEMANAYAYSRRYVERITTEWLAVLRRDHSHPCVVAWVPVNESWGVPRLAADKRMRAHLRALYHLTHSVDGSRPVVSNDGWEHAETDLLTLHDYRLPDDIVAAYTSRDAALAAEPAGRPAFVVDGEDRGQPLLITEFGGLALAADRDGWGYETVSDGSALLDQYAALVDALLVSPVIQGFCYTQLTDVEQEMNGLLTADRRPKAPPERIREITTRRPRR